MSIELYSVIRNEGPANVLFWKFPKENFYTGSQLIVQENEEAIFVKDGIAETTFSGGKYTLSTNNIPVFDKLRAFFSGGKTSFTCKIFFISKTHALELKWGTDAPIALLDPVDRVAIQVRGRGAFSIKVKDSKKFWEKFVGSNIDVVTPEAIQRLFRSGTMEKVKSLVGNTLKDSGEPIINAILDLEGFAKRARPGFAKMLDEYGVELVNFYVSALEIPEDSAYMQAQNEATKDAYKRRREMQMLGVENWQRVQSAEVMKIMANNEGAGGSMAGMGVGMGMGMAAGGAFGALAHTAFAPMSQQPQTVAPPPPLGVPEGADMECPQCHAKAPAGAKFCPSCGGRFEEKKAFCTNCGAQLTPGARFCAECGQKQ